MFSRLIYASKDFQGGRYLFYLNVERYSASMWSTFRGAFQVVRVNTRIRYSYIRISVKQWVVRYNQVILYTILARTRSSVFKRFLFFAILERWR